jgi:hypothetical protein
MSPAPGEARVCNGQLQRLDGYHAANPRECVEEKTTAAVRAAEVATIRRAAG